MDVYCPKCGEPCDIDYFHDVADEMDSTYAAVSADFRRRGCIALGSRCSTASVDPDMALAASAMYELLGDDMDGAAGMLEDFGLFR